MYVESIPEVIDDSKLYISETYGHITHKCLCGCGLKVEIPIQPEWTDGWQLIKHDDGRISITPSISNYQFPCKSHYIITKNVANLI